MEENSNRSSVGNSNLHIKLDDGTHFVWKRDEFYDFEMRDNYGLFVVKNEYGGWIGIYNMSDVMAIEMRNDSND